MSDALHAEPGPVDPPRTDLSRLTTLDDSALRHALRRVLRETTDPHTAIAGFNSFSSDPTRRHSNRGPLPHL
ncbi:MULTISPECIES: FxSxx-COOH cyclophane-containing RiPP peptide [Protofrankia]|uniref:FXSXX-COOH protein n=1 Tax=Candidatus Protofrankia datiscae TaxID=2716812 RepID=F8B685_9ACTN|nr:MULTISPECIES: FxSxx-COOH cyclophane-containing RiPP peptide [Protofrankia]AEH08055.1 hypothetical protein FsymDg_0512 [Candidatus Protofrankia datiscae]